MVMASVLTTYCVPLDTVTSFTLQCEVSLPLEEELGRRQQMGQRSHGRCPSAHHPAPLSFPSPSWVPVESKRTQQPWTQDTVDGHGHIGSFQPCKAPKGPETPSLALWDCVFSEYLSVTGIQECKNSETWGQGSILQMGTMGKDPELKLLMPQSTLVCRVVGMQVCWAASKAIPLCCLDSSSQLLCCLLFSCRDICENDGEYEALC